MTGPVVTSARPWLTLEFATPMRVLSWALNRPGFVMTRRILWREVRNADLPLDLDVGAWLSGELDRRGATDSVAFLTSRDIALHHIATANLTGAAVQAVATVGLSNAERVGARQPVTAGQYGTINVALSLDTNLSDAGLIEALSIAVEARTAAVLDTDVRVAGRRATGTGTDCLAIAAPPGDVCYAGLHTPTGEAIGRAV